MRPELDSLPPGPRLPKAIQSLSYKRAPIRHWERLHERYGDFGTARLDAYGEVVWISDPATVREVLLEDPALVHAGEAVRFLEPILGARSMLVLDEADHMRKRRLLLPAFHGGALAALESTVVDAVDAAIERWPVGEEFALLPHMKELSLEVILRAVFGLRGGDGHEDVREAIADLVHSFHLVLWGGWRRRTFGGRGAWAVFLRRKAAADRAIMDLIAARRREGELGDRHDVLSRLVHLPGDDGADPLTDEEIRDDLATLLIAGHETTSVALTWSIGFLARHPEVVARLRCDPDGEYAGAVIKESLRLRPIVPFTGRTLTAPLRVRGRTLSAGTKLWIPILLVHVLPGLYPDPHTFRPERFLDEEAPEPYAWLPFGGGIRRCIGAGLANLEMAAALRAVAARVELRFTSAPVEAERVSGVTLVPRHGGRIALDGRLPVESQTHGGEARAYVH